MAGKKIKKVWDHNFASSEKVRGAVLAQIKPKLDQIRDDRMLLEERWLRYFRMWNVTHDEGHRYQGRAKLYIPEVRKNVEAQSRALLKAAFPNEDFFTCSPGNSGTLAGALIQKSIRTWQLEQARFKSHYHVFARQECLYGNSPIKIDWCKKTHQIFRRQMKTVSGKTTFKSAKEIIESYNGPRIETKDLFKWYALDPRKRDFQEDGCVEYQVKKESELRLLAKKKDLWGIEELIEKHTNVYHTDQLQKEIERMEDMDLTIDDRGYAGEAKLSTNDEDEKKSPLFLVGTIYAPIVLPEACDEDEDPEMPIPMWIEIYNDNHVGLVKRNPFFHQKAPYVVGRYIQPNPDEFYGQGIPWAIEYMQHEINSKAEQAMDSATLALNPIALIDPALAHQMSDFTLEPGATWFVNPQGVKFATIPDTTATGYAAISQLRAQIADFSDRTPSLPPQLQGKSRSATQSDIVNQAVNVDLDAFAGNNEREVLEPLLEMMEYLTDQHIEGDQVIMVLGRRASDWKKKLIPKKLTLGRYNYFWKASSFLKNKQILSRQMIDAMKVAGSLPPEAQMKLKFDFAEAFRVLWSEGFELPDGDKIIGIPEELTSQDPEVVARMIELGMEVEVLPGDNEEAQIRFLDEKVKEWRKSGKDEWIEAAILQMLRLKAQMEEKQRQLELQRQQQMMMMQMQAQGAGGQGGGGSQGSGNRTQLSPNASAGDMGSGVRA